MVALWNRAGHYIFILWFLLLFFHTLSQQSQIGCLPYFHTCCGLNANLGCRSETCCTRLAENTGRKKVANGHHRTTLSGYHNTQSSQLRHVSTIGKEVLSSNMSSRCPHNIVNFGPLAAEIGLPVWGIQANFHGFRDLASLLHGVK